MNIPGSGFNATLRLLTGKQKSEVPAHPTHPITREESSKIVEGFREYARCLVAVIDSKGIN